MWTYIGGCDCGGDIEIEVGCCLGTKRGRKRATVAICVLNELISFFDHEWNVARADSDCPGSEGIAVIYCDQVVAGQEDFFKWVEEVVWSGSGRQYNIHQLGKKFCSRGRVE